MYTSNCLVLEKIKSENRLKIFDKDFLSSNKIQGEYERHSQNTLRIRIQTSKKAQEMYVLIHLETVMKHKTEHLGED